MTPYALKVEGRVEPLEIDRLRPRFSWRLSHAGVASAVARIRVQRAADGVEVWAHGLEPFAIDATYAGPPLDSRTAYRWRVECGGQAAQEASFETGLMPGTTTEAAWIGRNPSPWLTEEGNAVDDRPVSALNRSWRTIYSPPPLQLRRSFTLEDAPTEARILLSAHGVYRAYLNGRRIGTDELTPGWTSYQQRIQYQRYDVTALVRRGPNVLTAEVADGWWSGYVGYDTRGQAMQYGRATALLAELKVATLSGNTITICTDDQWRERPGGRLSADLLMGEDHDASLDTRGWRSVLYSDTAWRPAVIHSRQTAALVGQVAEPIRIVDEIRAETVTNEDGRAVIDFGRNVTGRVRLRLRGVHVGDQIEVRHGETLDRGSVYVDNLRTAEATDRYLLADYGDCALEPSFTFHGFRYAEVTGLRQPLHEQDAIAVVLSSALEQVGTVETSSELVNTLVSNIFRSQVSNFVGLPTDCPQRDERLGWTADIQVFAPTAAYNQDVNAFLRSWLLDLQVEQAADGTVPDVAPVPPLSDAFDQGAPGWGDAAVLVPWHRYRVYGDLAQLRSDLPSMRRWVDQIRRINGGGLWVHGVGHHFGDWLSVNGPTPKQILAAAYQIRSADLVAQACRAVSKHDSAAEYDEYAATLRRLFAQQHLSESGDLTSPTQTGRALALMWELVPPAAVPRLAAGLIADVEGNGRRLTTGFHGVAVLLPALTKVGRSDLAYDLLLQRAFPSWGYSIDHGATSIWERWDGWTEAGGFQAATMNSFNHYSLGSVGAWIYESMCGISDASEGTWTRIRVAPQITDRLESAQGSYESPRGRVAVGWRRDHETIEVRIEIPPGSRAEVDIPPFREILPPGIHTLRTLEENYAASDVESRTTSRGSSTI